MQIAEIPFGITDWAAVRSERKKGESGYGQIGRFASLAISECGFLNILQATEQITGARKGIFCFVSKENWSQS